MILKQGFPVVIALFISVIMALTSCSQETFSARKYQHLDYVKAKPNVQDEQSAKLNPEQEPNTDLSALPSASSSIASLQPEITGKSYKKESNSVQANAETSEKSEIKVQKTTEGEKALQKVESYQNLSKSQQKKLNIAPEGKFSGLDNYLKLAIIFGAVGVVLLILGVVSSVFAIIGGIAIVVGLVFLLLYLLE